MDLLIECGFSKLSCRLELRDRVNIVQTVSLHKVILASMAELLQLKDGLRSLGVIELIEKYPDLLYSFYCVDFKEQLTSGDLNIHVVVITTCIYDCIKHVFAVDTDSIRKLFSLIKFSEKGSNDRECEERAFMFFINYLEDCEKSEHSYRCQ